MKKSFWLIILFCTLYYTTLSQSWNKTYDVGKNAIAYSVIEHYDKGYVIAGSINLSKYALFKKVDINGNELWNLLIGNNQYDIVVRNIDLTIDGGMILCLDGTKYYNNFDAYIIKLNSCAEIEWCKVLLTPNNYDLSWRVKQTPEGDYVLLGGYFITNPASNISLFKFNASGDLIWHQFCPHEYYFNEDQPCDLLLDTDGYLITSSRYAPDSGTTSPQIIRSYFVKTDTAGNKLWDLVYGVNNNYYSDVWGTVRNSSGKYYHSSTHSGPTSTNPALIWISHDGMESGDKDLVETNNTNFCGMSTLAMLNDTNIVFFGGYRINNVFQSMGLRTDTSGIILKAGSIPYVNSSYTSTTKTFNDKFVTVGNNAPTGNFHIVAFKVNSDLEYDSIYTQPFTYDSLCPYPIVSDTIDPNCDNVLVSVDEPFKKPETTQLNVYPNPTDKTITIELPKYLVVTNNSGNIPATTVYHQWSAATLQAIDLQGKTFLHQEVANTGVPLQLDVSHLPAGMYQFRLVYKGKQVAGSKVVVK